MEWKHKCDLGWLTERQKYLTASDIKSLIPFTKTSTSSPFVTFNVKFPALQRISMSRIAFFLFFFGAGFACCWAFGTINGVGFCFFGWARTMTAAPESCT